MNLGQRRHSPPKDLVLLLQQTIACDQVTNLRVLRRCHIPRQGQALTDRHDQRR